MAAWFDLAHYKMAYDFSKLDTQIKETEEWLQKELSGVRTGRATPTLLDGVKVLAYDTRTPLKELASISTEDARTLRIIPWDKTLLKDIEKGIVEADLGVGTSVDDTGIRVTFPELTSERRAQLTKLAGEKVEQARVTLRGHRTDALHEIEALKKEGMSEDQAKRDKEEVQKHVDKGNEALEELGKKKEREIAS
jgi:ribosome recycling factor